MKRYSTPAHIFSVDIDLTDAKAVYVTYAQNKKVIIEKAKQDLTITKSTITVNLSQEDTGKFKANKDVEIQIRYLLPSGVADASDIIAVDCDRVLKEGVIE